VDIDIALSFNIPLDIKTGHFRTVLPSPSHRIILKKLNVLKQKKIDTNKLKNTTAQKKKNKSQVCCLV